MVFRALIKLPRLEYHYIVNILLFISRVQGKKWKVWQIFFEPPKPNLQSSLLQSAYPLVRWIIKDDGVQDRFNDGGSNYSGQNYSNHPVYMYKYVWWL